MGVQKTSKTKGGGGATDQEDLCSSHKCDISNRNKGEKERKTCRARKLRSRNSIVKNPESQLGIEFQFAVCIGWGILAYHFTGGDLTRTAWISLFVLIGFGMWQVRIKLQEQPRVSSEDGVKAIISMMSEVSHVGNAVWQSESCQAMYMLCNPSGPHALQATANRRECLEQNAVSHIRLVSSVPRRRRGDWRVEEFFRHHVVVQQHVSVLQSHSIRY